MRHQIIQVCSLDVARRVLAAHCQRLEMGVATGELGGFVVAEIIREQAPFGLDDEVEPLLATHFDCGRSAG